MLVKIRGRALPTSADASTATGVLMAAVATARGRRSRTGLARTAAVADGGVWTTLSRQTALEDGGRAAGSSRTALTRRSRAALEARPRADGGARGPDSVADGATVSRTARSPAALGSRTARGRRADEEIPGTVAAGGARGRGPADGLAADAHERLAYGGIGALSQRGAPARTR